MSAQLSSFPSAPEKSAHSQAERFANAPTGRAASASTDVRVVATRGEAERFANAPTGRVASASTDVRVVATRGEAERFANASEGRACTSARNRARLGA